MLRTRLIAIALACAISMSMKATEPTDTTVLRPVSSSYLFEFGGARLADTYLTPLRYSGWDAAIGYTRRQAMKFAPDSWIQQLDCRIDASRTLNPAHNATMWDLNIEASWGMMKRFDIAHSLTAGIGPYTGIGLGARYLSRNGNNPVAAKANWTVGASAYAAYRFRVGNLPLTARYSAQMPLIGAFFAPDYGELYYEIYLGNDTGLAHAAWWGNFFRINNLLTVDIPLGSSSLTIGYRADVASTKANHIVTRTVCHNFVLGVTTEWLSLDKIRRADKSARIISANY